MKLLKLLRHLYNLFKSLFTKQKITKQKTTRDNSSAKRIKKSHLPIKTMKQKRNEWLSSKGYTPREVVKSTRNKVTAPSHHQSMVVAFAKAKKRHDKIYDNGLKGKDRKLIRNKYGIPFHA